jgi:L-rhamnose mutarotase
LSNERSLIKKLFRYFNKDLKEMGEYPIYKKWLKLCDPLQEPITTREEGDLMYLKVIKRLNIF